MRSVRILNHQLQNLESAQMFDAVEEKIERSRSEMAQGLSRAVATLMDACRKRERTQKDIVSAMTEEEKDQLVKARILSMPDDRRKSFLLSLQEEAV
jgi:hypothetical protein